MEKKFNQIKGGLNETTGGLGGLNEGLKKSASQADLLGKAFQFNQIAQSITLVTGALSQFTAPFIELDKQVQNIGTLGVENFQVVF